MLHSEILSPPNFNAIQGSESQSATDSNHICTRIFQTFFQPLFKLFSVKKYFFVFVLRNFLLLHKLKERWRPNLCQLFTYAGPKSTLVDPNHLIQYIFIDQLQQGKTASVPRKLVNFFLLQLCLCAKPSGTLFPVKSLNFATL